MSKINWIESNRTRKESIPDWVISVLLLSSLHQYWRYYQNFGPVENKQSIIWRCIWSIMVHNIRTTSTGSYLRISGKYSLPHACQIDRFLQYCAKSCKQDDINTKLQTKDWTEPNRRQKTKDLTFIEHEFEGITTTGIDCISSFQSEIKHDTGKGGHLWG